MTSSKNERKYSIVFDIKVMHVFIYSKMLLNDNFKCVWKQNVFYLLLRYYWTRTGVTFLFLSCFQSETVIYLVTEPVRPLEVQLNDDENFKSDLAISWGLHQITVCFLCLLNTIPTQQCVVLVLTF